MGGECGSCSSGGCVGWWLTCVGSNQSDGSNVGWNGQRGLLVLEQHNTLQGSSERCTLVPGAVDFVYPVLAVWLVCWGVKVAGAEEEAELPSESAVQHRI